MTGLGVVAATDSAELHIGEVEVQVTQAGADARAQDLRPVREGTWRHVPLPNPHLGAGLGEAPLARNGPRWVCWLRFHHRPDSDAAVAIYVVRPPLSDIVVLANGIAINDDHWNSGPRWNTPAYFVAPRGTLQRGVDNEILMAVLTRGGPARMSTIEVGPTAGRIHARYELRLFATETVPRLVTTLQLAFAAFVFAFWWRRRNELAHLLCAATMVAWSLYLLPYHMLPSVGSRWALAVWSLGGAVLPWVIVTSYAFTMHHFGIPRRAAIRALLMYACASSVLTFIASLFDRTIEYAIWSLTVYVLPVLVSLAILLVETRVVWRARTRETVLIVVALWVQVLFAVHDALQALGLVPIETLPLVPLSASLTMCAFAYVVLRRYLDSLARVESSHAELQRRLAERTRELEVSHARLRAVEREQALADERQRLMREMHDGVGSSLMSSLVLVERGGLDSRAVAQVLRESIDDLKLTIDSLEPIGHDLLTLLGTLRYRLGARLERAGLKLAWQVRDLPPLPWLDAGAALQVLRILQEALTNVIKHAGADTVHIETDVDGDRIVVRITDNGRGVDDAAGASAAGRGLHNMRQRASALQGDVDLVSRAGCTVLTLRLPLVHRAPP